MSDLCRVLTVSLYHIKTYLQFHSNTVCMSDLCRLLTSMISRLYIYVFSQMGEYISIFTGQECDAFTFILDIKLKALSIFPISWNNSDRKPLYILQTVKKCISSPITPPPHTTQYRYL